MEGTATSAEEARKRGNDLYKQGKLKDGKQGVHPKLYGLLLTQFPAEAAFEQAASLAPDDPAPLSNLSSVQFELGNYDEAARLIQRSLALTKDVPGDEAADRKKQMLYARLGKCYMHDSKFEEAREVVEQVTDNELKAALGATIDVLAAWRSSSSSRDQATHRSLVFDRLPRFKPYLYGTHVLTFLSNRH
jgi:tetratricopeptide (TPR) repeat protein